MPEDAPSRSRGAYVGGDPVSYEEALRRSLAFREATTRLPGNIWHEEMKQERAKNARSAKLQKQGRLEVYGPPNPFKPSGPSYRRTSR